MKSFIVLLAVAAFFVGWAAYGYYAVRGLEEPRYELVSKQIGYEIRRYGPMIIAETPAQGTFDSARTYGTARLKDFIGGNNAFEPLAPKKVGPVVQAPELSEKIAATIPITESLGSGARTIGMSMPQEYTLTTLPKPNNAAVTLRAVPARTVAVVTFTWSTSAGTVAEKTAELLKRLNVDNVKTLGQPVVAFYSAPWSPPFMLHSEIQVEIR